MRDPVLVIHGVANRDPERFQKVVAELNTHVGATWDFIPVYWGDLGANPRWVGDTLPSALESPVRAADAPVAAQAIAVALLGPPVSAELVRNAQDNRCWIVADAASESLGASSEGLVRGADSLELRAAIATEWRSASWLPLVGDDAVLRIIGRTIGSAASGDASSVLTRAGPDLGAIAQRVLHDMDELVGSLALSLAGRVNNALRMEVGPGITEFFGDVLVYQRRRDAIHQRVRAVLDSHVSGYGTEAQPIAVVGHSLGGVIGFDLATVGQPPIWSRLLVTFGSQSPYFHVIDPRGGALARYHSGQPVVLPATLPRWTNLWEPLDPLAFVAAKVFRLPSGAAPLDVPVASRASSGLWTHSVYWRAPELVEVLRETLAR